MAATAAFGATATFDPSNAVVSLGEPAVFDVTIAGDTLSEFETVSLALGWDQDSDLTFSYSSDFLDVMTLFVVDPPIYDFGIYTRDAYVGGARSTPTSGPILVGTVTFNTAGLGEGVYDVRIDATRDRGVSTLGLTNETEDVFGSATVTVTSASVPPDSNDNENENDNSDANDNASDEDDSGDDADADANVNDNTASNTNDNSPAEDDSDEDEEESANDNSSDEVDDSGNGDQEDTNDNAPDETTPDPNANANSSPSAGSSRPQGGCGLGTLGAFPFIMTGLFMLQAERRGRARPSAE